jgi:CRISPR type III-associated protein (TIGR04423 family)
MATDKFIIEEGQYEGYLWYSDKEEPEVYWGDLQKLELDDAANPFVIEGMLYDKSKSVSYSIRYADGHHIVKRCSEKDAETMGNDLFCDVKIFEPHDRMKGTGVKRLCFKQYWKAEPDKLCEGMKVRRPYTLVFSGFNKKED